MKILLNTSTQRKGGPLQRAVSFIKQVVLDPRGHDWHIVLSAEVAKELGSNWNPSVLPATVIQPSPARNRNSRRRLAALEAELRPDGVFTFMGPSYVKFQSPHLLGCADPWVTHSTWISYAAWSFPVERTRIWLESMYKRQWFPKAEGWIVETETARQGLHHRLHLPLDRIWVVSNSCAEHYRNAGQQRRTDRHADRVRLLCFCAAYKHKRLDLIPRVARELKRLAPDTQFEFVLTLVENDPWLAAILRDADTLGVRDSIRNIGRVPVEEGPDLYRSCDVMFLPTVLETFTATYPESMVMGVPIVTSDLDFARGICQDAACYFRAADPVDAARVIVKLLSDDTLQERCVERGYTLVKELPTQQEIYDDCLKHMIHIVTASNS